jgi:hypothetical protein
MIKRPLLALLLLLPLAANAERYRVDAIVFLDRGGATTELPKVFAPPDLTGAVELDPAALAGSAIELIPDTQFGLPEVWNRLRYSRRYQPLVKLAWLQTDPQAARTLPLHIRSGAPVLVPPGAQIAPTAKATTAAPTTLTFQSVDGTIALRLSRYLYLDADLYYTQPLPDGRLGSYRLKEVRKMRRDDVHYLDSPKLGIVARVTKATVTPTTTPAPAVPAR